jgi:phosphatidate cytidylyltransferase
MILTIYLIILTYFIIGGLCFYFIYRKREKSTARRNYVKFITYFLIIHIIFFSIVINGTAFHYLAIIIVATGVWETLLVFRKIGYGNRSLYWFSIFTLLLFCSGFLYFSRLDKDLILFTFLIVSIFDAFSQIIGEFLGRQKIFPSISPGKTVEGLIGGTGIALISSFFLNQLVSGSILYSFMLAVGIVLFAFLGDLTASLIKRIVKIKDFSQNIPGHGGVFDRFDSLIGGATFITLITLLEIY